MQVTAKADYAIRAMAELAAAPGRTRTRAQVAEAQGIPGKFLEAILSDLRRDDLVLAQRGPSGGYRLARPAEQIALADVVRAVDGPLAAVRGLPPEDTDYLGPATSLREVWVATRAALRAVLENVSLADLVGGDLPADVQVLVAREGAWRRR